MLSKLNNLPDDILFKILEYHHYKCIDCDNIIYYCGNKKYCIYCKKNLCNNHLHIAKQRGNLYIQENIKLICNNCWNLYRYMTFLD